MGIVLKIEIMLELNEEVLYHMEKKSHLNLYAKDAQLSPTTQPTLLLLELIKENKLIEIVDIFKLRHYFRAKGIKFIK